MLFHYWPIFLMVTGQCPFLSLKDRNIYQLHELKFDISFYRSFRKNISRLFHPTPYTEIVRTTFY